MAIQMDFEFTPGQQSKRRVYRVLAPGLAVQFAGLDSVYSILDLSVGGMAIRLPNVHDFNLEQEYTATFQIKNKLVAPTVKVCCLRINDPGRVAAFEFVALNDSQEAMLDKLVLALQKRNIQQEKPDQLI